MVFTLFCHVNANCIILSFALQRRTQHSKNSLTGLKSHNITYLRIVLIMVCFAFKGAAVMTAVERLVPLSGKFQRIALSATIRPLETVAEFIGGYRAEGDAHSPQYTPRPV